MIRIDLQVRGEEVLLNLTTLPRRLRERLRTKLTGIMQEIETDFLSYKQGKYLDKDFVNSGVEDTGGMLVGYVEAGDKPDEYPIFPTKGELLRFIAKSGDIVYTKQVLHHKFPKGTPIVERYFHEKKPWLLEQAEDAIFDVVYNNA